MIDESDKCDFVYSSYFLTCLENKVYIILLYNSIRKYICFYTLKYFSFISILLILVILLNILQNIYNVKSDVLIKTNNIRHYFSYKFIIQIDE